MDALIGIAIIIVVAGGLTMGSATIALTVLHRTEVADPGRFRDPADRTGNTVTALIGIVAGVLLWALWISWGDYDYPTWAIVGCVISSLVVVVLLGLLARWRMTGPFVAGLSGLFGFSSACGIQMGIDDYDGGDGLWGVGYLIIILCGGFVLTFIALGIMLVRLRGKTRTPSMGRP